MLRFDAGRATRPHLADAGVPTADLDAPFVAPAHSDHVVDLADVAMTRWMERPLHPAGPLPVVCPEGEPARVLDRGLDPSDEDIAPRAVHVDATAPDESCTTFVPTSRPGMVWTSADGVVGVSGDTRVRAVVEALAAGAAVVVHEVCRRTAVADAIAGTVIATILRHRADAVELGGLAQRAAPSGPHPPHPGADDGGRACGVRDRRPIRRLHGPGHRGDDCPSEPVGTRKLSGSGEWDAHRSVTSRRAGASTEFAPDQAFLRSQASACLGSPVHALVTLQ